VAAINSIPTDTRFSTLRLEASEITTMIHPSPEQINHMTAHASDDRRPWFIGVNVLCLVLAYFAVGLRIISRLKIGTNIALDDYLIIASALLLTGHVTCLLVAVKLGMGRHAIFVTNLKDFAITNLVGQTFYSIMVGTIKLSILSLYARIFQRMKGWFKPTLWSTALIIVLIVIPQCFSYVFQCVPIDSLWTEYAGPQYRVYCLNFQAGQYAMDVL
jgi:magnesium-transporting ATPase (P-type)